LLSEDDPVGVDEEDEGELCPLVSRKGLGDAKGLREQVPLVLQRLLSYLLVLRLL